MSQAVLEIVREFMVWDNPALSLDAAFEELGVDSLEFILIVRQVEDVLKVRIPDDAMSRIHTIRDLEAEALRSASS